MKMTWIKWENNTYKKGWKGPMIGTLILGGSIVALLATVAYSARPDSEPMPLEENRSEAAKMIRQALDASGTASAEARARLADAARRAAERLGPESRIAGDLLAAVGRADRTDSDPATVRRALEEAHKTLTFQPLMEAELPRGFPAPGPLGEIRVKKFPAYRMAVSKSGAAAFWTLFRHIKRNEIAMTAPVEMSYGDAAAAKLAEESMAFLYGDPEMGRAGPEGSVEVVDAVPVTVASLGLKGRRSDAVIEQARDELLSWIEERPEYEVGGPLRVLGYNSPFVPRDRQYWEVQVPVKARVEPGGTAGKDSQ